MERITTDSLALIARKIEDEGLINALWYARRRAHSYKSTSSSNYWEWEQIATALRKAYGSEPAGATGVPRCES